MKTVWKFQVDLRSNATEISMPVLAEIVHAQMQNGIPCFWAIVDPNATKTKRTFVIVGTGHGIPENFGAKHVRSFQDGEFIWHLFETDF